MKEDWSSLAFILASQYRKKVILTLREKPMTPIMISDKTELYLSHVSLTLNQLEKKGLVVCLTPNVRKGKLFDLTKDGKNILNHLKESN